MSKAGVFEIFFEHLASLSTSADLVQMFDSTVVCAPASSKQSENSNASSASRYDARRPNKISHQSSQSPQASS
ncbi:hypothetical protein [Rhizobium sp. FY34]|uniref:hypothetical protein n=1 Tax=Rhizobium sp. FY34 TaxID=2562309 RepID=UPI001484FAF3|nr:hypothetical protein [Rhizobium sp. FY34]